MGARRLVHKISNFGVLAKEREPSAFEQGVVRGLTTHGQCRLAWRTTVTGALPEPVDFVVDLSERGAGRAWCEQAPHGVWFLSIGERNYLDLVPALSENFDTRAPSIPVTLARWRTAGDVAETLTTGNLRRRRIRRRHVQSVLAGAAEWFVGGLKRIKVDALPNVSGFTPCIGAQTVAPMRRLAATAQNLFDLAAGLFTLDMWNIGILTGGSAQQLFDPMFMRNVHWLPRQGGLRYRADPFGFRRQNGDIVVFHESWDYRVGKGIIARIVGEEVSTVREFSVHAAYPYLFEHDGKRYCLPELSESGSITLFAVDESSLGLVDGRAMLPDVPLIDGTVFVFGGLNWLFGTRADDEYNVRLFAWYSEGPFGPWQPHACNPIKTDITSARSAGTPFLFNGSLIRPAQDCSRTYGGAVVLNRIIELSPTRFAEEPIGRVEPDPDGPYRDGVHTLCVRDGFILVDGKYCAWRWLAPLLRVRLDRASARRRQMMSSKH